MPRHRLELPRTVPRLLVFFIPTSSIGKVLGPGGKVKRALMDQFSLSEFDLDDSSGEGRISISSFDEAMLEKCKNQIEDMIGETSPPRKFYEGEVVPNVIVRAL